MNEFFVLYNYIRKIRLLLAEPLLNLGISLVNFVSVDGFLIRLKASAFPQYFLRAEGSWSREQVTMYWIRDCVSGGDVVMNIGANVELCSLSIQSPKLQLTHALLWGEFNSQVQLDLSVRGQAAVASVACL